VVWYDEGIERSQAAAPRPPELRRRACSLLALMVSPKAEAPHVERRRARAILLDVGGLLRGAAFVFLWGWDCVRTSLLHVSRRAPTGLTRIYGTWGTDILTVDSRSWLSTVQVFPTVLLDHMMQTFDVSCSTR
jgi:hypothetical protein